MQPISQLTVSYNKNDFILDRFVDYFKFCTRKDIGPRHEPDLAPNLGEKVSNIALWIAEEFPRKVFQVIKEPRFVALALTVLALGVTSLAFYPTVTISVIKAAVRLLPNIPYWAVKFGAYILTCETILALGLRTQSRLWHPELVSAFEHRSASRIV
jgi:hypothetical protein